MALERLYTCPEAAKKDTSESQAKSASQGIQPWPPKDQLFRLLKPSPLGALKGPFMKGLLFGQAGTFDVQQTPKRWNMGSGRFMLNLLLL